MNQTKSYQQLLDEIRQMHLQLEETLLQLEEANDTIEAIRSGEVDALVVKAKDGHQLYTLKTADQTYRIFIEQMTEGAVTLNHTGNILYSNSRFAELIELPLEKVIGQPFHRFILKEDEDLSRRLIEEAWETNNKNELRLLSSTGKIIPALLSLKTLSLDEGLCLSIILTDLTVQKQTHDLLQEKNIQLYEAKQAVQHLNQHLENTVRERTAELEKNIAEKSAIAEQLRGNQERLTRILETMAEGVWIIDTSGNLTYANLMAQKILGLKPVGKIEGKYFDPRWPTLKIDGTHLSMDEHPMHVAMKTGKPLYDYEIGIAPPDADKFYISINAAPIYDEHGEIAGSVGTFMDVTNRRRDIQQKDDFISVASHELKTPVTTLKAYLQMLDKLKHNSSAEVFPGLIEKANKSMGRISNLIEDLLNTSKITQGQWHLNKTRFILADIVEEFCQHLFTDDSDTRIITEGSTTLEVYADADRIGQVLTNFVNNAVKYAPDSKQIIIHIEKVNNYAKLSVKDYGPGVQTDKLPHLFDRYYRVDDKGAQYSGLGLGLYICAEIIKKHGGEIGVESIAGQGSTFWFSLPL